MSFQSLGLSIEVQQALKSAGYESPTPVQSRTIPAVLKGKDVLVSAQTGTGKTASFVAPMLDILSKAPPPTSNRVKGLILSPTRELALQLQQSIVDYGSQSGLSSAVVFGGVKINPQMMRLRKGVHLLVATPGRLLDLRRQNAIAFDQLKILVLDEADKMLNLGFREEINQLLNILPRKRQTLMFSATLSPEIKKLANNILHKPVDVAVTPNELTPTAVKQWLVPVDKKRKTALLINLIEENNWHQALVFSNTKKGADRLAKDLTAAGHSAGAIHGDKSQALRLKNLQRFKTGKVKLLIATDVASRGLDIGELPIVLNFDLPKVAEDYVHRIGRTGRASESGEAVSLVCADEFDNLRKIEQLLRAIIPREYIDNFDPKHNLPESKGVPAPGRPKKPKKPKKQKEGTNQNPLKKPSSRFKAKLRAKPRAKSKTETPRSRR